MSKSNSLLVHEMWVQHFNSCKTVGLMHQPHWPGGSNTAHMSGSRQHCPRCPSNCSLRRMLVLVADTLTYTEMDTSKQKENADSGH